MTADKKTLSLLFRPDDQEPGLHRYRGLRRLWKALPLPRALRLLATNYLYRRSPRAKSMAQLEMSLTPFQSLVPKAKAEIARCALVLSGYLSDTSGIGRGGRMSERALRAAGLEPICHDLRKRPEGWGHDASGGVWFCHCNAPEAGEFLLRSTNAHACYRIGYWAWELPNLPSDWVDIAALFHEIWVPSQFVANGLRRASRSLRRKVRVVPHPLPPTDRIVPDRARFGIPDDVYAFLCMYDVHSSATRKNPMAVIKAFQRAFAAERGDVLLVVKVVAAHQSRGCLDGLRAQAAGWGNIRFVADMLDDDEADRLIASTDAFVSLHRAEGFGLSIAQAMALGRPVIVTNWSGNVDFCGKGAAKIAFDLVPVEDPDGVYEIYAPGQMWAEPDILAAAKAMRDFARAPARSRKLGEAGRRHIRKRLPKDYDVGHLTRWLA